jgi:hypothetical protein
MLKLLVWCRQKIQTLKTESNFKIQQVLSCLQMQLQLLLKQINGLLHLNQDVIDL